MSSVDLAAECERRRWRRLQDLATLLLSITKSAGMFEPVLALFERTPDEDDAAMARHARLSVEQLKGMDPPFAIRKVSIGFVFPPTLWQRFAAWCAQLRDPNVSPACDVGLIEMEYQPYDPESPCAASFRLTIGEKTLSNFNGSGAVESGVENLRRELRRRKLLP